MRIRDIFVSVFRIKDPSPGFRLEDHGGRWIRRRRSGGEAEYHVMHVLTDDGIEGICTVGDVRYTTILRRHLEQLRDLVVGEDALDRSGLFRKVGFATRIMYTPLGWQGSFDNCLWDIAGKVSHRPVCELLRGRRQNVPAYYNCHSDGSLEEALEDATRAVGLGYSGVKDHYAWPRDKNLRWLEATRATVGEGVDLMHDAAVAQYNEQDARIVGAALEDLNYCWFEEPLPDQNLQSLIALREDLSIPLVVGETLMYDHRLLRSWFRAGAMDKIRANARHGTTPLLKLAEEVAGTSATIELNGPGGLFGLVHAHLISALPKMGPYEYFPGGSRDEIGREIGLENPSVPIDGRLIPPEGPGWGAVWDRAFFEKRRVATL